MELLKKCDMCNTTTNTDMDVHIFGDWMECKNVTVHYFCLLLSTNLQQNGRDCNGILGFLIKDIRTEINHAAKRLCCYCGKSHATISCYDCKDYFHLSCGRQMNCLFHFSGEFRSYCNNCAPQDDIQMQLQKCAPAQDLRCFICKELMGTYTSTQWIHANCCKNGFVHRLCMQKYASAAGYYLKCIWCKNKDFRESVKLQGIFVPDRDAQWERQKNAFSELHRGHSRCDMEPCLCPRGRDYISASKGKWTIINCALCGSFGAHNPSCIPGKSKFKNKCAEFKCELCSKTEELMNEKQQAQQLQMSFDANRKEINYRIDKTMYQAKAKNVLQPAAEMCETPTFSSDETLDSSKQCTLASTKASTTPIETSAQHSEVVQSQLSCIGLESTNNIISSSTTTHAALELTTNNVAAAECEHQLHNCSKTTTNAAVNCVEITTAQTINAEINDNDNVKNDKQTISECITISSESEGNAVGTITQSPVITSTSVMDSQQVEDNDYFFYNMYELDDKMNCLGTVTVRIDFSDARFVGKSIDDIQNSVNLIEERDIVARNEGIGIFAQINEIIDEFME